MLVCVYLILAEIRKLHKCAHSTPELRFQVIPTHRPLRVSGSWSIKLESIAFVKRKHLFTHVRPDHGWIAMCIHAEECFCIRMWLKSFKLESDSIMTQLAVSCFKQTTEEFDKWSTSLNSKKWVDIFFKPIPLRPQLFNYLLQVVKYIGDKRPTSNISIVALFLRRIIINYYSLMKIYCMEIIMDWNGHYWECVTRLSVVKNHKNVRGNNYIGICSDS